MSSLLRDLAGQVEKRHVYTRPADLAAYSYDAFGASGDRRLPDAVVFPGSTDEVAGVVQVCAHHGAAIIPRGAGTGYAGGSVSKGGVIVCLTRMDRILGVEPDAQRMKVEAGVLTAAVHRRAAEIGLYYPPDPGSASTSTIGGNIACNAGGPHTLRYGTTGDYVAAVTAVLADGRIVELGEGSGGDDLLGALIGCEGTLGIVTEAILRLLPAPGRRATLSATFADMATCAEAVAQIAAAAVVPAALEYMDQAALEAVAVSGFAHVDAGAGALLLVELEGEATQVVSDTAKVEKALTAAGASAVQAATDEAGAASLWRVRNAISAAVATVMIGKVNEDVVVPRGHIAAVVTQAREIAARHDLPLVTFGHAGDGNLHLTALIDPRRPGDLARAEAAMSEIFDVVVGLGGSITGEHGVGVAKRAYLERQLGPDGIALMRRLKHTLDPRGLLNPGKKIAAVEAEPAHA